MSLLQDYHPQESPLHRKLREEEREQNGPRRSGQIREFDSILVKLFI